MFNFAGNAMVSALMEGSVHFEEGFMLGGPFYHVTYPNGFTVSIVKHFGSYGAEYGLWEGAVIRGGELCYDTDITSDVVGFLSDEDAINFASAVRRLNEDGSLPDDDPYFKEDEGE